MSTPIVLHLVDPERTFDPWALRVSRGIQDVVLHVTGRDSRDTDVYVVGRDGVTSSFVRTGPCGCP